MPIDMGTSGFHRRLTRSSLTPQTDLAIQIPTQGIGEGYHGTGGAAKNRMEAGYGMEDTEQDHSTLGCQCSNGGKPSELLLTGKTMPAARMDLDGSQALKAQGIPPPCFVLYGGEGCMLAVAILRPADRDKTGNLQLSL